jgi:hypothetical protein
MSVVRAMGFVFLASSVMASGVDGTIARPVKARAYATLAALVGDSELVVIGRVVTDLRFSLPPSGLTGEQRVVVEQVLRGRVLPTNILTLVYDGTALPPGTRGGDTSQGVITWTNRDRHYLLVLAKRPDMNGYACVGREQGVYEIDGHNVVHPADRHINHLLAQKYGEQPSDLLLADVRQAIAGH